MYVYIHIYIYTYIFIHIYIHTHTYSYIYDRSLMKSDLEHVILTHTFVTMRMTHVSRYVSDMTHVSCYERDMTHVSGYISDMTHVLIYKRPHGGRDVTTFLSPLASIFTHET